MATVPSDFEKMIVTLAWGPAQPSTCEQVDVKVINRLASIFVNIRHQTIPLFRDPFLSCKLPSDEE